MNIDVLDLDDIKFENSCRDCYGSGIIPTYSRKKPLTTASCRMCNGAGKILTNLGEDLIKFLESRGFKQGDTK